MCATTGCYGSTILSWHEKGKLGSSVYGCSKQCSCIRCILLELICCVSCWTLFANNRQTYVDVGYLEASSDLDIHKQYARDVLHLKIYDHLHTMRLYGKKHGEAVLHDNVVGKYTFIDTYVVHTPN